MRLRHPDGSLLHLAYCSNVHPADDLDGVAAQLEQYAAPVRERLGVPVLGVGLWVGASALADPDPAARLGERLGRLGLEVVTLNGFPYRAFHAPVVKHGVYVPSWADEERLDYTIGLAELLCELLPDDVAEGSISTLPLGWREGWSRGDDDRARAALVELANRLERLEAGTGRRIRVALEPEPGCRIETVGAAIELLADLAPERIGICLDACHLAVQFEDAAGAVAALADAGVGVVKAQISNALRVPDPAALEARAWLARFVEPRFLHQVRERVNGGVAAVDDLDQALAGALPGSDEWRVHFHVPVHAAEHTTQSELRRTLAALAGGTRAQTRHFEVETYTWSVLPEAEGGGGERRDPASRGGERANEGAAAGARLVDGIAAELRWTRDRLLELGACELGGAVGAAR